MIRILSKMNLSEIRSHLGKFRVGIAGAGGLGSNCAIALARSGVGTLVLSDFDIIEESNLTRQYYFTDQVGMLKTIALKENISRVNPDVFVIVHQKELNRTNIAEIFSGCDVIVEAFDSSDMKEMLIETINSKMHGIPLIIGSGVAGWGRNESVRCRKIDDTLYVCGDESSEVSDNSPTMAPRVGIVANMQANIVIEILMKMS
ncbi:MAG: sulfur carrier protein ThiS adenylyltransferase ThiF [Bacteroidales bacterium]|nr:sulfur carrier protein ThiS adenylyltransferase ThiF [Bacteroidales bacterium]